MENQQQKFTFTALWSMVTDAGFNSYLDFSRQTGIPELILHRIDCGLVDQIPLKYLRIITNTLNISLDDFIIQLDGIESYPPLTSLNREDVVAEIQQSVLEILESLLLQLPTIIKAVDNNPDLPASRVVPLLKPFNDLLSNWDIRAIAPVGAIVEYDPQIHQLMTGSAETGQKVEIRYVGYQQKEKLLYRAKVSPLEQN